MTQTISFPWRREHAAHLIERAGFGSIPSQVAEAHHAGPAVTVARLLRVEVDEDLFPPADSFCERGPLLEATRRVMASRGDPEAQRVARRQLRQMQSQALADLRAWWIQRMRSSPNPLREKMTLFWHGHFATSFEKVRDVPALWRQNELFRTHALGDFSALAAAIPLDPAMMRYLDILGSSRQHPNENFAREYMELFLLGEGAYSEEDIREAARAFTGFRMNRTTQEIEWRRGRADEGEKRLFGKVGPFGPKEVAGILLSRPQCAPFLAKKIWCFFAGPDPSPGVLDRLARRFRESGYRINALLRAIFLEPAFYSPRVMEFQIKSPVEWMVGSAIRLERPLTGTREEQFVLGSLGQALFRPPNVRGWEGGNRWISTSTFLARCNLAGGLFLSGDTPVAPLLGEAVVQGKEALAEAVVERMFPAGLNAAARAHLADFAEKLAQPVGEAGARDILRFAMTLPEYQLA